jgi:hypothetical protein
MKHAVATMAFILLAGLGLAQQLAEEAFVINVEVPVRVFKGNRFVDNLTIKDFELFEDGKPQKLEAVYLIKKRDVERRDEVKSFNPRTNRSFYLFFQISEYTSRIGDALDYFIRHVITPGDSLIIVSPVKTYRLKVQAFELRSRTEIVSQIKGLLRNDAKMGNSEYNGIIADLEDLCTALIAAMSQQLNAQNDQVFDELTVLEFKDNPVDDLLIRYEKTLALLGSLRLIDQEQLLNFSRVLKSDPAQKYVYLFYEREFIPQIEPKILMKYMSFFQDRPTITQRLQDVFGFYKRDYPFDIPRVKAAFADASITIHFLMVAKPAPTLETPGIKYQEQSEDIFNAFQQMAQATGGYSAVSENAEFMMKSAVEASENCYLLYYAPSPYVRDGKFREITLRIKGKDYRISHRAGYFAN